MCPTVMWSKTAPGEQPRPRPRHDRMRHHALTPTSTSQLDPTLNAPTGPADRIGGFHVPQTPPAVFHTSPPKEDRYATSPGRSPGQKTQETHRDPILCGKPSPAGP